mmetsp:Transcript_6221/g.12349  ORF Transcript_6221/g.12349 Transcript_6221/m.12349 type:complete len:255 (-) Transcript_6221:164-928(-)
MNDIVFCPPLCSCSYAFTLCSYCKALSLMAMNIMSSSQFAAFWSFGAYLPSTIRVTMCVAKVPSLVRIISFPFSSSTASPSSLSYSSIFALLTNLSIVNSLILPFNAHWRNCFSDSNLHIILAISARDLPVVRARQKMRNNGMSSRIKSTTFVSPPFDGSRTYWTHSLKKIWNLLLSVSLFMSKIANTKSSKAWPRAGSVSGASWSFFFFSFSFRHCLKIVCVCLNISNSKFGSKYILPRACSSGPSPWDSTWV